MIYTGIKLESHQWQNFLQDPHAIAKHDMSQKVILFDFRSPVKIIFRPISIVFSSFYIETCYGYSL